MAFWDFFSKKTTSSDVAKGRLKMALVADRAYCSPDIMEQIKNDIIDVISRYMDVDKEGLDIQITQTDVGGAGSSAPAIFANIPIKEVKRRG
jgi:cell division topological specificity factor